MVRISRRQHCRLSITRSLYAFVCAVVVVPGLAADSLFNGTAFDGWEGDINDVWRIENKEIVGGSLSKKQERNNFLCTTNRYTNFDLRLRIKLSGTKGFINSGIQFRSERVRDSHEVAGYQADFGAGHDGALYDESRRKKFLARPPDHFLRETLKKMSGMITGFESEEITLNCGSMAFRPSTIPRLNRACRVTELLVCKSMGTVWQKYDSKTS